MLSIAAAIEAFWSSARWLPPAVKYGVAAICWMAVIAYLRRCRGAVQVDALAVRLRPRTPMEAADLGVRLCQSARDRSIAVTSLVGVP